MSPWADFAIDDTDRTPVYAQLERGIRSAIASGRLAVGDQLPTVRQLAVDLRVNANTVARVYAFLERTGVLETRRGVGTFVSARTPAPQEEVLRRSDSSCGPAVRAAINVPTPRRVSSTPARSRKA